MYSADQAPTNIYESPDNVNMNSSANVPYKNVIQPPPAYNVSPATQVWYGPPVGPQQFPVTIVPQNINSSSNFHRTFLKGKPKALGVVMIVAAVLQIALGIALIFIFPLFSIFSGIPFWGSVFYIIAGALTIVAYSRPNICMVKGSLSLNIISSIFSFIAFILNCVDLSFVPIVSYSYYYIHNNGYENEYYQKILNSQNAVLSILLITNLLLFCVSLSVSIFGCRSLAHETPNVPQVFVLQNDVLVTMDPSTVPRTFPPFAQSGPPPQYRAQ